MTDDLTADLPDALAERFGVDADLAAEAAEKAAAFDEEYDLELTAADVREALAAAPYDSFRRRWNWWVGDVAADLDDCTNSRPFRFAGFDAVRAVQ